MSYVYQSAEMFVTDDCEDFTTVWEVGYFHPNGMFYCESRWQNAHSAAAQVSYLNGGLDGAYPGNKIA